MNFKKRTFITTLFLSCQLAALTPANISTDQACYSPGDTVRFSLSSGELVTGQNLTVLYRHLTDTVDIQYFENVTLPCFWDWQPPVTDYQGYLVTAVLSGEAVSIAVDVSSDWSRYPRYGFLADFPFMTQSSQETVIRNLNRHHINGIQFYDWQWKHHRPLCGTAENPAYTWHDIANRINYRDTIQRYVDLAHSYNMKAMAYNLIYGAYETASTDGVSDNWRIFTDSNHQNPDKHDLPDNWASDIYLINPANSLWQDYLIHETRNALDAFNFDGWHIDQLGDRGTRYDYDGNAFTLSNTFGPFLTKISEDLAAPIVFNAVDQYGQTQTALTPVEFLYTEVWSNTSYPGLLSVINSNNTYSGNQLASVLAAYVNKGISGSNGTINTPAVLLADAVIFSGGGTHLELGEHYLANEYFPSDNLSMTGELQEKLIRYYDFHTAYENVLRDPKQSLLIGVISSDSSIPVSRTASTGKIWFTARQADQLQILHFINFIGTTTQDWRDPDGTQTVPLTQHQIPLIIHEDSTVTDIWMASPDTLNGQPLQLSFIQSNDSLLLTIPYLDYWSMLVIETGTTTAVRPTTPSVNVAGEFLLMPNYPNPFNGNTVIPFTIRSAGKYSLQISNLAGQCIYQDSKFYPSGHYNYKFDGNALPSGIYLCSLQGNRVAQHIKIALIK